MDLRESDVKGGKSSLEEDRNTCKGSRAELQTLRQILFLGGCIKNGTPAEEIPNFEKFCTSANSKIRQLALRICRKDKRLISRLFKINDPSSSIRKVMVRRCRRIQEIAVFFRDCNSDVKIAALKSILSMKLRPEDQNKHIMEFLTLVNDREYEVRLLFARCLKRFDSLQEEILLKLFDKEDIGTLIYAAEEEYEDIRGEAVSSLPYILKKDVAAVGFDFLMDILGDDSLAVREIAMASMYKICKKFTITKDSRSLLSILNCLREMSPILKKYLLKIISILQYEEPSIINCLFNTNLEDLEVLKTIDRIVRRNRRIFEIAVLRSHYIFSSEEDRKSYKMRYLADLVILKRASKNNSILLGEKAKTDWKMVDGLLKKSRTNVLELEKIQEKVKVFIDKIKLNEATENEMKDSPIKRMKRSICDADNGLFNIKIDLAQKCSKNTVLFSEFLQNEIRKLRLATSFGKFLKSFISDLPNSQECIFLIPLKFCSKKGFFKRLVKKYEIRPESKESELSLGCIWLIYDLIDILKSNPKILCLKEYKFECPYVIRQINGLPIEFHVECAFESTNKNIFLVLENGTSKLFYKVEPAIHIILDNCPSSFTSYIAYKLKLEESEYFLCLTQKVATKVF